MNYYERHLGDYAKDTAHLSMLEHGAYSLLLDRYYATEEGIPESQAHRLARARTRDEKSAVDAVLFEFFTLVDGVWRNSRADEEIINAQAKICAAKENGKKGGRPKKVKSGSVLETKEKPSGFQLGSVLETQEKAHQTPVHQDKEPPIPPKGGNDSEKSQAITLKTFLSRCKSEGVKAIPDDHPAFDFADDTGIPYEWLTLVWREFTARYSDNSKRYRDWRRTFNNAVRGNWFKVWYCGEDGKMYLTSQGRLLEQAHREAA